MRDCCEAAAAQGRATRGCSHTELKCLELVPWKPRGSADQPIVGHKLIRVVGHTQKDFEDLLKFSQIQRCTDTLVATNRHNARAPLHCVKANLGLGGVTFRCIVSWRTMCFHNKHLL